MFRDSQIDQTESEVADDGDEDNACLEFQSSKIQTVPESSFDLLKQFEVLIIIFCVCLSKDFIEVQLIHTFLVGKWRNI